MMNDVRSPWTDNHGNFDIANIGVAFAIVSIIGLAWFLAFKDKPVNLQDIGVSIAAIIAALGAYKWGDSKQAPPRQVTP